MHGPCTTYLWGIKNGRVNLVGCEGHYFKYGLSCIQLHCQLKQSMLSTQIHPKKLQQEPLEEICPSQIVHIVVSYNRILLEPPNDEERSPLHLSIANTRDKQSPWHVGLIVQGIGHPRLNTCCIYKTKLKSKPSLQMIQYSLSLLKLMN